MKASENKNRMAQKNNRQKSKEDSLPQKDPFVNDQSGQKLNAVTKAPGIIDMRKKKNHDLM
jgi:hypothetical protein